MIYDCKNVRLTQAEIDEVITGLTNRAVHASGARISSVAADSALQKFLAVQRATLAPSEAPHG